MNCRYNKKQKIYLSDKLHPQTIAVVQTRASAFNWELIIGPISKADFSKQDISGILVQYPDTQGDVQDFSEICKAAKQNGVRV